MAFCLISVQIAFAQQSISGKVTPENEEGIVQEAIVRVFDGTRCIGGTVADFNGDYELKIPAAGTLIEFSAFGYQTLEVKIDKEASELKIDAVLKHDNFNN